MSKPRTEGGVVVGNTFDKYSSRNPLVRWFMRGFFKSFDDLVARVQPTSVLEVGCGEGELSLRLARSGARVEASDISASMIAIAQRRALQEGLDVEFSVADIMDVRTPVEGVDLLVCCEVFEHLKEPQRALHHLAQMRARNYLFSVPREPLWRVLNVARGRYLTRLGNTPGHLKHWSRSGFRTFVETQLEIEDSRSPLPWTMLLARSGD